MIELNRVSKIFDEFERRSGIRVTETARAQIVALVNAVQLDPHETWDLQPARLDQYYSACEEQLPRMLHEIVESHQIRQKITALDVVYWLGQNLASPTMWVEVCPFPRGKDVEGPLMMRNRFPWNIKPPGADL